MSDEDPLFKAKLGVSADGATGELVVGKDLPEAISKLMPHRQLKALTRQAFTVQLLQKENAGQPLEDAEIEYLRSVLPRAEARLIRERQIGVRAARALEAEKKARAALGPMAESPTAPKNEARQTAEDWIAHFWDDAGLVTDEVRQEIYGRILASEAQRPGTSSMRTLQALRYMDRATADGFAKLVRCVFHATWLPNEMELVGKYGITYDLLLDLDEARLINSNPLVEMTVTEDPLIARYGDLVLVVESALGLKVQHFPLTAAGRELAKVAQVERSQEYFFAVARWLQDGWYPGKASWAKMPFVGWQGESSSLTWYPVPKQGEEQGSQDKLPTRQDPPFEV